MRMSGAVRLPRRDQPEQAFPWSACAPAALAAASVMYSPCLVFPYHYVPWQW